MKKKLPVLLALCLAFVFTFAGCGAGGDPADQVKETAEGFFSALQAGDIEKAETFATEDAVKSGLFDIGLIKTFTSEVTKSIGVSEDALSDDAKAQLEEFEKEFSEAYVTSYEVGDARVNEDGKSAVASAAVTFGFDPEKAAEIEMDKELEADLEKYMKDNEKELMEIFEKDGEKGVMEKVINDMLGTVLDAYMSALKETGETDMNVEVQFEKTDSGWLISGFTEEAK